MRIELGDPVPAGPTFTVGGRTFELPSLVEATVHDIPGLDGHHVWIGITNHGNRPEVFSLEVHRNRDDRGRFTGRPVTSTLLRKVPVGDLTERVVLAAVSEGEVQRTEDGQHGSLTVHEDTVAAFRDLWRSGTGGRRTLDDAFLEDVASTYRLALAAGRPPTRAVMDWWGLSSRSTASNWVRTARDRGLLGEPPAERQAGEVDQPEDTP